MIIVVDGYNVLKQVTKCQEITEQQRRSFIKELAIYKRLRRHKKIMVIFDGGPNLWQAQKKIHSIEVIYAGASRTADEYIYSFIQKNKMKSSTMLLVSSDHQLCQMASDNDVASIDVQEFYTIVQQTIRPPGERKGKQPAVKLTKDSSAELDKLMQEASKQIMIKQEDLPKKDEWKSKRLSKSERTLLKRIKKL